MKLKIDGHPREKELVVEFGNALATTMRMLEDSIISPYDLDREEALLYFNDLYIVFANRAYGIKRRRILRSSRKRLLMDWIVNIFRRNRDMKQIIDTTREGFNDGNRQ